MNNKIRLDVCLVEQGLVSSREQSKAFILAGYVKINDIVADKPGMQVKADESITVTDKTQKYVSRGGFKLEKAIEKFAINLNDKICCDIGASTGGFTDCMLQNGARKVFAVDVGYGQLDWKLRNDERVINLERENFRNIDNSKIPELIDFASIDVAFISTKLIFPKLSELMAVNALAVSLVKPQFEAGKGKVGKNGVVRDHAVHLEVIDNCMQYATDNGFSVIGLTYSPIKGPQGNIEFLMHLVYDKLSENRAGTTAKELLASALNELGESK